MQEKLKLTIELIPFDSFEKNLRFLLSKNDWDTIRKFIYKKFKYECGICKAKNTILSAHEEWEYKITNAIKNKGTQKLKKIWSLCTDCHYIKHIAFADELARQGKLDMNRLVEHFIKVNNCNEDTFIKHYNESVKYWNEIANIKFKLNIKYIEKLNLPLESYPYNQISPPDNTNTQSL